MKKILSNIYNFIKSLFKLPDLPVTPNTPTFKSHTVYRVAAEKFEPISAVDNYTFDNAVIDKSKIETLKILEHKLNVLDDKIQTFKEKSIIKVNKVSRDEALRLSGLGHTTKEIGTHFNVTQANVTNVLKERCSLDDG